MQFTSLFGISAGLAIVVVSMNNGGVSVLNTHGFSIVVGGTLASLLFHCSWENIKSAIRGFVEVFATNNYHNPEKFIAPLVSMAQNAKENSPVAALQVMGSEQSDPFIKGMVETAIENHKNPDLFRVLMERQMLSARLKKNETINVYRAASVLAPMYGLIGTLVGIIQVLSQLSEPERIGSSMAVAISSALYGIALANIVFVPVAGKLRSAAMDETLGKTMILEGVYQTLKSELPIQIEKRLMAFIDSKAK